MISGNENAPVSLATNLITGTKTDDTFHTPAPIPLAKRSYATHLE